MAVGPELGKTGCRVGQGRWQGWAGQAAGLGRAGGRVGQGRWQDWARHVAGLGKTGGRVGQGRWQGWAGQVAGLGREGGRVGQGRWQGWAGQVAGLGMPVQHLADLFHMISPYLFLILFVCRQPWMVVTSSVDAVVKMWDIRSIKVHLYCL